MKIVEANEEHILFDNDMEITAHHNPECCEYNYADFEQVDDIAMATEFDPENIVFEKADYYGFMFGNKNGRMFFVPCYSQQNGYYSNEVDIYFDGDLVLCGVEGEEYEERY